MRENPAWLQWSVPLLYKSKSRLSQAEAFGESYKKCEVWRYPGKHTYLPKLAVCFKQSNLLQHRLEQNQSFCQWGQGHSRWFPSNSTKHKANSSLTLVLSLLRRPSTVYTSHCRTWPTFRDESSYFLNSSFRLLQISAAAKRCFKCPHDGLLRSFPWCERHLKVRHPVRNAQFCDNSVLDWFNCKSRCLLLCASINTYRKYRKTLRRTLYMSIYTFLPIFYVNRLYSVQSEGSN